MAEGSTPVEIFCSYAHEDKIWLQKLEKHLSLLQRQGLLSLWYDRLIIPGTDWGKTIDTHLETASVILLLVSADFFASDYCYGIEMKRALEREVEGSARVVPILVRPADWAQAPFAHLQALPTDVRPIVSWRNKDTALADVAAGIRRVIVEDLPHLTASAPRAALPGIWNIPYPRNPFFLGRESELLRIRQNLQTGQAMALSQPQAISGLGGIGKTQLALEYAYRYYRDYVAVLWVRAESTEALISSYVAIASLLQLPERSVKEQEVIVQSVKTWLQTHRSWLLVLDNADELTLLPDYMPPALAGHLILTTRAAVTGRLAYRLEIEPLLPQQGALFLLRRASIIAYNAELSQTSPQEQELAMQISQELGGLPLALDQAGAYLEETGSNLADYWRIYQQHRVDLLQRRGGLVTDHPTSVIATISLSFRKVEEKNPAAADLLRLCAYLAPDAIPEEILTEGSSFLGSVLARLTADAFQLNRAIEALRAYSLVQRNPKEKLLSVHRLVQVVLQDAMDHAERRIWARRAVLAVSAAFPHPEYKMWPQCERLLAQVLLVTQTIERYQIMSGKVGRLLADLASYLQKRARFAEAEPLYQQAVRICEQQLGLEHPEVANALNGFAILYRRQGRYVEAELFCQQSLRIREKQLGPEHSEVAYSLHVLGILYAEQVKYTEAEPLFQRALRIREQQLGPEHLDVAYTLNNLAELYRRQGNYAEAERFFQRALHIREKQLDPEDPEVAYPLAGLAELYFEQGKYAEAESLYQRSLQIWERQLGPEHPEVAYPLTGLAELYVEQGKYAEAEQLFQHALHIREQQLGPAHPETAETLHALARFREVQGNSEEARVWYVRALAVREQAHGRHHPKTTETRTRLITLLHTMGLHEEAAQLEAAQVEM